MLNDVPKIDQSAMEDIFRIGIRGGFNTLILGPSGGGKTLIAQQIAESEGCHLVYVNLSVLERTDFQGLPVISSDKSLVTYATPEFLPFADTQQRDYISFLDTLEDILSDRDDYHNFRPLLTEQREKLEAYKKLRTIKANKRFAENFKNSAKGASLYGVIESLVNHAPDDEKKKPIVFLFDEVDKAAHEVLQTLLEFLQFRSVNGRKLDIQACILTANLPDEFAHSSHISHAITKRCLTYKLELDFNQWRRWAFKNEIHEHIIGFLSSDPSWIYKRPPDNDQTAYALPSPRTWTSASNGLKLLESKELKLSGSNFEEIKWKIIAGNVGESAATHMRNWVKHYKEMDPVVNKLLEEGIFPVYDPTGKELDNQQIFICAISACNRVYADMKPDNEETLSKHVKNVYKWIKTLPTDIQMGTIRMAFGGDFENILKYKLAEKPEFVEVFKELHKSLDDWKKTA